MKVTAIIFFLLNINLSFAQSELEKLSEEANKALPEVYDSITKLQRTTVENGSVIYHFLVNATQAEFDSAVSKVKAQVLKTICAKRLERQILLSQKADIFYRYENLKGQSLGQIKISYSHCQQRSG